MKDSNLSLKNESVYRRTGVSAKTSPALRHADTPTRLLLAIPIAQGHNERLLALIPYLIFALLMFGSSGIFGALVVTSQRERSRARHLRRPPAHRAR